MAEIVFNTRLQQKYGTHADWTAADPTPKEGELCVVVIPAETGAVVQEPTILFKVGDGTKKYSELNFAGALAADVYDWAKAKDKPVYTATEITGIGDYIAEYVDETLGISVDTDTQYRITKVDDYNYKLQSKAKGEADTAFVDVSTIVIPKYDDTGVTGRISALETLVGSTAVATQISNAIAELDLANTYAAKSHTHTKSEITDFAHTHTASEVTDFAVEVAKVKVASATKADEATKATQDGNGAVIAETYATKTEAEGYANAKDEAIQAAQDAADNAQAGVDTLVGEVEGDDTKSARTIANEEATAAAEAMKDAILGEGIKDTFDTLKEVQDWIEGDGVNATELTSAIAGEAALREQADTAHEERLEALENGHSAQADAIALNNQMIYQLQDDVALKANDADLATIAKTGSVADLIQNSGDVLVFNCGGPAIGTDSEYTN